MDLNAESFLVKFLQSSQVYIFGPCCINTILGRKGSRGKKQGKRWSMGKSIIPKSGIPDFPSPLIPHCVIVYSSATSLREGNHTRETFWFWFFFLVYCYNILTNLFYYMSWLPHIGLVSLFENTVWKCAHPGGEMLLEIAFIKHEGDIKQEMWEWDLAIAFSLCLWVCQRDEADHCWKRWMLGWQHEMGFWFNLMQQQAVFLCSRVACACTATV